MAACSISIFLSEGNATFLYRTKVLEACLLAPLNLTDSHVVSYLFNSRKTQSLKLTTQGYMEAHVTTYG